MRVMEAAMVALLAAEEQVGVPARDRRAKEAAEAMVDHPPVPMVLLRSTRLSLAHLD
ncbi:hypothetical protein D3C83_259370 [compost metagenome]